ncbi:relaxase/mobilization nuclease domain-containing protein [Butyrivibrio sp. NC2007]|uniref:relaxase/mobilization nuclease domain-containing protein n=1 Tax=Butyrivibrio sp. NC2007 TaxID=1280683 RepID=UPI0003B40FEB|nr:relaxase/mobilization nuclease domain-containing protein [Butyrivibrio sp. NC2007]
MAITKAVSRTSKSHGGLRNCIQYALKAQKVREGYVTMTGPSPDELTWDSVYNAFMEEKRIWDKDNGRMYAHTIISFHKDEQISPAEVLEFGKEFADKTFPNHQTLITVHQDKDHLHLHMVTNSVSYIDGHKLHSTKHDLDSMKLLTNAMCIERGLTVAQKGHHFNGEKITEGTLITWSKDKYKALINLIDSFVHDCALALMRAKDSAVSKDDFIFKMHESGWETTWTDRKKHITFSDKAGHKLRDTNLAKTYSIAVSKQQLLHQFDINNNNAGIKYNNNKEKLQEYQLLIYATEERLNVLVQYMNDCKSRNETDELVQRTQEKIEKLSAELDFLRKKTSMLKEEISNAQTFDQNTFMEDFIDDGFKMSF